MACERKRLPKPVVATMVMASAPGVRLDRGRSGRRNLNYLAHPWLMKSDMEVFREIHPFRRLVFVISCYIVEAEQQAPSKMAKSVDLRPILGEYALVPAGPSAAQTLASIPDAVVAVYVGHLFQMNAAERDSFVAGLIARKLPSFSPARNTETL